MSTKFHELMDTLGSVKGHYKKADIYIIKKLCTGHKVLPKLIER